MPELPDGDGPADDDGEAADEEDVDTAAAVLVADRWQAAAPARPATASTARATRPAERGHAE